MKAAAVAAAIVVAAIVVATLVGSPTWANSAIRDACSLVTGGDRCECIIERLERTRTPDFVAVASAAAGCA